MNIFNLTNILSQANAVNYIIKKWKLIKKAINNVTEYYKVILKNLQYNISIMLYKCFLFANIKS